MVNLLERVLALIAMIGFFGFFVWSSHWPIESRAHRVGDKLSLIGLRFGIVLFMFWMGLYGRFFSTPVPGASRFVILLGDITALILLIASPAVAVFFYQRTRYEIQHPEQPTPFI